MLKSGYLDYPKFGYIRTIWPTENQWTKSEYPNTLFLEHLHHFFLHCPHHFHHYVPHNNSFFVFGNFFVWKKEYKNRKKIILGRITRKMKRKMMKIYDYITDRSFEAFVTVIEISIFGFENSTLHLRYLLIIWRSYYIRYYTRFQNMRYPMALNTPGQPAVHMHHLIFLPCEVSNFHPKSAFFKIRHYMCVGCFRILANHWVITTRESKDRNGPMQWEVTNHI